jgi:hypothetical protein
MSPVMKRKKLLQTFSTGRNEYTFQGEIAFITLYDRDGFPKKEKAIIDKEDYSLVKNHRWCLFPGNYIWNNPTKSFLHNMILGEKNVDHKDNNGLDNRRTNLRPANQSQNNMNKKIAKNNTSGFKGVHYDSSEKKWKVQIRKDRKLVFRKLVATKEEAAILYDQKSKEIFGEFARNNQMEGRI